MHLTSTCLVRTNLAHFVSPHLLTICHPWFVLPLNSNLNLNLRYPSPSAPLLTSTAYGVKCLSHSAWLGGYTHSRRRLYAAVSWLEVPQIVHEPGNVIRGVQRRSAVFESSGSWMFSYCGSYPIRIHHARYHREYSTFLGFVEFCCRNAGYMNIFDWFPTLVGGLNSASELIPLDPLTRALNDNLVLPSDRLCKWSLLVENVVKMKHLH